MAVAGHNLLSVHCILTAVLANTVCQTNVVNMPHLSEGEMWLIVALGTDRGWTQDKFKN